MHSAPSLRQALRRYIDLLDTRVLPSPSNNTYTCIYIYFYSILGIRSRTLGVSGMWFLRTQASKLNRMAYEVFSYNCTVFDTQYEYKSVMDNCAGKEYMTHE